MSAAFYTAAEVARALGCTAPAVRKAFARIPADGRRVVSGVEAAAWSFAAFPSPVVQKLAIAAQKHGHRTPVELLSAPPIRAELHSLKGVALKEISRAQKLRDALAAALALPIDTTISERARLCADDFARVVGHRVSDRYLRRLLTRTIERAGADRNFARLDLYLPDAPQREAAKAIAAVSAEQFSELHNTLCQVVRDRTAPALSEIAECWRKIIELIDDRIAAGAQELRLKRELRCFIVKHHSYLGATHSAVKRTLNRKLREAIDGGGIDSLVDGRIEAKPRPDLLVRFESEIKLCAQHATFHCGKRESQAYRQLHLGTAHNDDRFSPEFRAAYPFNVRKAKSAMPKWFRAAVTPMVEAMWAQRLGPRAARLALPSIRRDWSNVLAGASYTSDDVTLNHYVVDWNADGEYEFDGRRFNVCRPQFLPVIDERTGLPLGFSLIAARAYNSRHIRTLMTRICMRPEIGLPFEQFAFERGIWSARNVQALVSWALLDESFARVGVHLTPCHHSESQSDRTRDWFFAGPRRVRARLHRPRRAAREV